MPRHEWSHKNRKSDASCRRSASDKRGGRAKELNKYLRFPISSVFGEKEIAIQKVIAVLDMD